MALPGGGTAGYKGGGCAVRIRGWPRRKVAYVFATDMATTYKLATMILPQLEEGRHSATVVGMFFFDDNLYCLRRGDPVGERLARIATAQNILLMICDQSNYPNSITG